ncbi:hypothetical protein BPOR_0001g00300 [Botrytis porri]|uniref:Uncharacterized protein n=2 Tax=Botrytis porri TaxID=87229 RepID=A0A4Z1L6Y3_9HELO|nr:hypothetical protein BPOR_0001g00300 [Botrytis porri]
MAISELDGEMKIAPIANDLFEFDLTNDEKKDNSRMNYTRQKPRVILPVKHSFRHRTAFIKAKAQIAYAEANTGQKCTGSIAFVKNYETQLLVADIDQFLQQAVTGKEDDMIIKQARDFWKRGTTLLYLQRCSEAEVKAIAKRPIFCLGSEMIMVG